MQSLQDEEVTDAKQLMSSMATWEESSFNQYLNAEANMLRKDCKRSERLREQGNKAYSSKNNESALKFYTDSIRFAPYSDEGEAQHLALALANRSAVLASSKEYRLALQDISLAFKSGYPSNLAYKLHERRVKCFKELGKTSKALTACRACLDSLSTADVNTERAKTIRDTIKNTLNSLKDKVNGSAEDNDLDDIEDYESVTPPTLTNPNPLVPAFSSSLSVVYNKEEGRHVKASKDISFGELLIVENPPVFFLHEESSGINCSHCFKESLAPLPSPTCTQTVFCCLRCQKEAMKSYHWRETKFMDVLFEHGLKKKEWFLALRAITMHPISYFLEYISDNKVPHDPTYGANSNKVFHSDDFSSMYNLVGHHEQWEWREHAFKAFFALFFIRCLQKSNYFEDLQSPGLELGETELEIGALMVHLMEVATMNSHEVGLLEASGDNNWLMGQTKAVGCSLDPSLVLLNHSCDPSIIRVNIGTSTVCYANRDLKAGAEVTNCYSLPFCTTEKIIRQPDLLKKYKFCCSCAPCLEGWPTFHQLSRGFNDVPQSKLKFTPEEIQKVQGKIMTIQKLGSRINQLQQKEDWEGAMSLYKQFQSAVDSVLHRPHQFFVISRRSYSTCLWVRWGNKVRRNKK